MENKNKNPLVINSDPETKRAKQKVADLLSTDVETLEKASKIAIDICGSTNFVLSNIVNKVHATDLPDKLKLYVMAKIVNWKTIE